MSVTPSRDAETSDDGSIPSRDSDVRSAPTRARERVIREEPQPHHPRYEVRGVVGQGGQGVVYRVFDNVFQREVALKTLRERKSTLAGAEAFVAESLAAAGLEHPNIVPMYDAGLLEDGRPFYTMRLVSGRSLREVLTELASGVELPEWSLLRLVQVVQQTCLALEFAHGHGVLHRDVKPGNIMLGPHGEVLLVDWGISRSRKRPRISTDTGVVKGTVAYMAPEQARGGSSADARADVYSVGVILYEALALRLPFDSDNSADLMAAILRDAPLHPGVARPDRNVPGPLAEAALRALEKDPAHRFQSARALHDHLQAWLEGTRDAERRRGLADRLHELGAAALRRHDELKARAVEAASEIARLEAAQPAWLPLAEREDVLAAREALERIQESSQEAFLESINKFTDALAHLAEHAPSRAALADLFWERFLAAEKSRERVLARTLRALVERFHDGRYARELEGSGTLRLSVEPPDATIVLHPLVERRLVLEDGPERQLGVGTVETPLAMGSYVAVVSAPGHETVRHPVLIERSTRWEASVRLMPAGSLPPGFVLVPSAPAQVGGDPAAANAWPARRVQLPAFAIARHPVTFGEYCEFLDDLGEAVAAERLPRTASDGPCVRRRDGVWLPDPEVMDDIVSDAPFPGSHLRLPVVAVSLADAEAYAAWRSRRERRAYRLPTAEEWEVAGRGVDGRFFPWGNTFDATLCHVRESAPGPASLRPVGAVPTDTSVHGVQDMAGCVHEWTSSPFGAAPDVLDVRGSSWAGTAAAARLARRAPCRADVRESSVGFRLAATV